MLERVVHVVSYSYPKTMEGIGWWDAMNRIASNLYLSRLPNRGEEEKMMRSINTKDDPLKLVVSVVDKYEISETLPFKWIPLMDPTREEEWKSKFGVNHYLLEMKDFSDGDRINTDKAARAVIEIQKCRLNKQSVLVHCKAGRTRSAMLVASVLAVYDFGQKPENADKTPRQLINIAIDFMLENRVQVKVHESVKDTAEKIILAARKLLIAEARQLQPVPIVLDAKLEAKPEAPDSMPSDSLKHKVDSLFASSDLKDEIMKMDAYKKLCDYRSKLLEDTVLKSNRAQHIEIIIQSIHEAKDGEWYENLMNQSGPAKKLVDAAPFFNVSDKEKDKLYRESLIEKLRYDIESLICLNLGCKKGEFEALYAEKVDQPRLQLS